MFDSLVVYVNPGGVFFIASLSNGMLSEGWDEADESKWC